MSDRRVRELAELVRRHLPELPAGALRSEEMRLRAFGLDSMGAVSLLAELESIYDARFPDETITPETFQTMGTIRAKLAEITAARPVAQEER